MGSDAKRSRYGKRSQISTHAPRVGSDHPLRCTVSWPHYFNSRSPCGERRKGRSPPRRSGDFNSRSPCGERLPHSVASPLILEFQLTLPVWGATGVYTDGHIQLGISTHAPRVGSDLRRLGPGLRHRAFQLTLPVWGATVLQREVGSYGSDFNSRSPCGERLLTATLMNTLFKFQLTLPVWGATLAQPQDSEYSLYFNSRSPCGERPPLARWCTYMIDFNSRSPCGERL